MPDGLQAGSLERVADRHAVLLWSPVLDFIDAEHGAAAHAAGDVVLVGQVGTEEGDLPVDRWALSYVMRALSRPTSSWSSAGVFETSLYHSLRHE